MTTSPAQESEKRTRKRRIDPKLRAWGWDIVPFDPQKPISTYRHHAIEEYPTALVGGGGFGDGGGGLEFGQLGEVVGFELAELGQ